ncbi:MAG TPA: PLP-dependent aminotransferase family protein [Terricaulis sp.]|nr:PLP-dependent aminotransferase family protein [Terricaulis sp.]
MTYRAGMGARRDRAIAAEWLSPLLGDVAEARVFVAPGAQAAIGAVLPMLARSGDVILAEPWTYPGFIAMARLHGVRLAPLMCDEEGPALRALNAQLKQTGAKAIYLNPTLQNPTTRTISAARRQGIVEIARKRSVLIVEDDAYGLLGPPAPAMARLDASSVIYLSTLSKCLSPGLRTAFVVAPPALEARMGDALRAACQMPTPLLSDLALRWIESGLARRVLAGVKAESAARMRMARKILPARAHGGAHGFHLWMPLPEGWDVGAYAAAAGAQGVVTVSSNVFAVGPEARPHVRISLGAAPNRAILERGLRALASLEQ